MALTKITGQVINDTTGLVVGVTTVGGGLSATDGFFSGIVTAVGDASFSGNVPVTCAAGSAVKLAPDPLNVVAVTIPAKSTPVSAKVTVPSPLRFSILLTLISDAIWVHFPPLF